MQDTKNTKHHNNFLFTLRLKIMSSNLHSLENMLCNAKSIPAAIAQRELDSF